MRVEVVHCAAPDRVDAVTVELPAGARVRDAIDASGVVGRQRLDPSALCAGVWGRVQPLDAPLRDGDRVELYRPLKVDPKQARRQRQRRQLRGAGQPGGAPPQVDDSG